MPDDEIDRYIKSHPFRSSETSKSACPYVNVVYQTTKSGTVKFKLKSGSCVWEHGPGCTSEAKLTAKSLMGNARFRSAVSNTDGKMTGQMLQDTAISTAAGGSGTVSKGNLYRAKRGLESDEKQLLQPKFEALGEWLSAMKAANERERPHPIPRPQNSLTYPYRCARLHTDSHFRVKCKENGEFQGAFILIAPAAAAISRLGRKVNAADWGHSKHVVFRPATYCEGVFSFGDGTLLTVWMCVWYGHESGDAWGFAADEIQNSGFQHLYAGATMITDRQKGAGSFDAAPLLQHIRVACGRHILENARSNAPRNEKNFHENLYWGLQRAKSQSDLITASRKLGKNYPTVLKYLQDIPKEQWIWFEQVAAGAILYGQCTSNMAEQTQSAQRSQRRLHPLNYLYQRIATTLAKVREQLDVHALLRSSSRRIIEYMEGEMKRMSGPATQCKVHPISDQSARVQYFDSARKRPHSEHIVNLATKTCTCLQYQDRRMVCVHALAWSKHRNPDWGDDQHMLAHSGPEYATASSEDILDLSAKLADFKIIQIPSDEDLMLLAGLPEESAAWVRGRVEGGTPLRAPPPAEDANRKNLHHRKRKGAAGNKGKISTRSAAVTAVEKKEKRLSCRKCTQAGRAAPKYDVTGHRSNSCPYELKGRIETIDLTVSSDDDESSWANTRRAGKRKRLGKD